MLLEPIIRTPIAISLGAIGGALSRYYLTYHFTQRFGNHFPYGTFFINITGCFLMGLIITLSTEKFSISSDFKLLLTTGFLGAYTTFSTYGLDTMKLLDSSPSFVAMFYWLGSAFLGIIAVYCGSWMARL